MKKYTYPLLLALMVLPLLTTSCADDETTTEPSEVCYISSFSMGSLQRTIYGVTMAGKDSIYTISYAAGAWPMTIDHRTLTIENKDSLPVRTQLQRVVATVEFEGVLAWRKADITNLEDTTWNAYNSSDSLDLTEPLHFRVISSSGNSSRTYTVKVNVHQQDGDSTIWTRLPDAVPLSGCGVRRALAWNGKMIVLAVQTTGDLICVHHPLSAAGAWTLSATVGTTNADPTTLQVQGNRLFMSTTDGRVLTSSDALNWADATYPVTTGLKLVAASDARLYALAGGKLWSSDGSAWAEEGLDDEPTNLPVDYLNSVYYTLKNGSPRLILVGRKALTDTAATVWAKTWETGAEAQTKWMYYTPNAADKYPCPMLENLCIVPYDGGLQALGGRSSDGRYAAMDSIFHSADHGITWKVYEEDDMKVDPALRTAAQGAQYLTAAVDDENFLWVMVDNKVWRGRINRLGFLRK